MASVVVTLDLVRVGEPELGVWCDRCLLPSAGRARIAAVTGMSVVAVVAVERCDDCGCQTTVYEDWKAVAGG